MATARNPARIEVALVQLPTSAPSALPGGTRPLAIAPITVPSMYGVRIEAAANDRSM